MPSARTMKSKAVATEGGVRPADPRWYCLRSQPKHEHIAAARLRSEDGLETFCPRVRFQRKTARGVVWTTEAMFPSYLFCRFDLDAQRMMVRSARGVRNLVHFGDVSPEVPEAAIATLRSHMDATEMCVLRSEVAEGEEVEIVAGAFAGLEAVVSRVLPARERVAVLLEFLGRTNEVVVGREAVFRAGAIPDPLRRIPGSKG